MANNKFYGSSFRLVPDSNVFDESCATFFVFTVAMEIFELTNELQLTIELLDSSEVPVLYDGGLLC